mmetsp:Transcript_14211/g.29082  ORF Transcript_14211/g.29082 Transcript_14211/m.29082 type:complete len:114 (+) Transcript_14211:239-580(+)
MDRMRGSAALLRWGRNRWLRARDLRGPCGRNIWASPAVEAEEPGPGFFPGTEAPFVSEMVIQEPFRDPKVPCYRVMDSDGKISGNVNVETDIGRDLALEMYHCMVKLNTMDLV